MRERLDDFPNLITSPPIFCHREQTDEMARFQRRLFIMSPLHVVDAVGQLAGHERPTFFYRDGLPVLDAFLRYVREHGGTLVCISGIGHE